MRWRVVIGNIGTIVKFFSFSMFIPLLASLIYWEKPLMLGIYPRNAFIFLFLILFSITIGLLLERLGMPYDFYDPEAFAIVSLSWMIIALISTLPFILSGVIPGFVDAFFESMSGLTTTGATVLQVSSGDYLDNYPHSIMLWRALIQWLGGMGMIVLSVAILAKFTRGGIKLFQAESPGPSLTRLKPRITHTAKVMWLVYCGFSMAEFIALYFCGMNAYDALYHTFTTMATGGFSSRVDSVGAFSPLIQWVITFFMLVAGVNFALIYFAFRGRVREMLKDAEFRFYIGVFTISALTIFMIIYESRKGVFHTARLSAFQSASILTTTGYGTGDFDIWPESARFILLLLMFIGGCAGSTGGGIKNIRIVIILKVMWRKFRKLGRDRRIIPVKVGGAPVPESLLENITVFFLLYILIFVVGTGLIIALGLDLISGASAVAASLGNVGPGLGMVGPAKNYAFISPAGKMVLVLLMWIGRLEIFTAIAIFNPGLYEKRSVSRLLRGR